MTRFTAALAVALTMALTGQVALADTDIAVVDAPNGGIQPQALTGADGTVHLIYFKGEPGGGDLFYVTRKKGETAFSTPIRVNSTPNSAVAMGTVRGGQLALGRAGRVHVSWNGSSAVAGKDGSPLLYARLNDDGTGFADEQTLNGGTAYLDGGGTVAADGDDNVSVIWHAPKAADKNTPKDEDERRVWIARSKNGGKTFARPAVLWSGTGACGCCGMRAAIGGDGSLYVLYRSAKDGYRSMYVIAPTKAGGTKMRAIEVDRLKTSTCPMSTMSMSPTANGVLAAWETDGQIRIAELTAGMKRAPDVASLPGESKVRKHPSIAINAAGERLVAWAENTAWQRGGALCWQLFDAEGKPTKKSGRVDDGIPVWGLPAAFATESGFSVVH